MNNLSKKLTLLGICTAMIAMAAIASAQDNREVRRDRHQIAKTEAKLGREQAQYNRDVRTGKVRAAAREQQKINRTTNRLRTERSDLRHDRRG